MIQYLNKFLNTTQYNKWLEINNLDCVNYLLENDSIIIHKKENRPEQEIQEIYEFGDILLYDYSNDKTIKCTIDEYEDKYLEDNNYVPQALCVISEGVLNDGYARFMSLVGIGENGLTYDDYNDVEYLRWSYKTNNQTLYEDTLLPNRTNIKPHIDIEDQNDIYDPDGNNYGFIPIERNNEAFSNGFESIINNNLFYSEYATSHEPTYPSLYLSDWTLNTNLFNQNTDQTSLLMDQDGKSNTATLHALHTGNNLYPAAHACYMYETEGITQGEWYLPSITELMLMMTRFDTINSILNRLGALPLHTDDYYWSSTEYASNDAYIFNTYDGLFYDYNKNSGNLVRAFCMLSLASD